MIRMENLSHRMDGTEISMLRSKVKKTLKCLTNTGLVSSNKNIVSPRSSPTFKLNLDHFPKALKQTLLPKFPSSKVLSKPL